MDTARLGCGVPGQSVDRPGEGMRPACLPPRSSAHSESRLCAPPNPAQTPISHHFRDLSKVLPATHKARLAPREPFLFLALKMNDF